MRRTRSQDLQDTAERGVWGERTDVEGAGSIMRVRGTGTTDFELPVMNFGYSFNLPPDSNAEVIMVSLGSDINDKVAIPTIPRDKQYQWPVGTGGVQHPSDPGRRIEFNGEETLLRDGVFVIGSNREVKITVDGSNVTIETGGEANFKASKFRFDGDMEISGDISTTGTIENNSKNIGSTHVHDGVDSGPSNTGAPV